MKRLPVYILAGGRSSRFGSDKARAILNDQPLLCHVAAMLQPVASNITVVADQNDKYDDLEFRTIADHRPGMGPLGGLDAALRDLPDEDDWLLLCSCDAAVVRRSWLNKLIDGRSSQHDAVAFRASRWQPMPGLYARTALPTIANGMKDQNRSMQKLLDHLRVLAEPLPSDWPECWQINTPRDLHRAQLRQDGQNSRTRKK